MSYSVGMRRGGAGMRRGGATLWVALVASFAGLVLAGTAFGFGLFKSERTLPSGGEVYGVAISDLNRDGNGDIVAGNGEGDDDHVSVYLGKGNGKFRPEIRLSAGAAPEGVSVGQLNGDGRRDFAVANYEDSTISLFLQKRNGSFKHGATLPTGPGGWQVKIVDLNRDGRPDLVSGNFDSEGADAVSVLLGKGNKGKFRAHRDYAAGPESWAIAIGRMNADKRPDVVSIDSEGNPSVLLTKRDGTLKGTKKRTVPGGDSYGLALGNFDGNRKRDVAIANYTDGTVMVLRGNGNGRLKAPISTDVEGVGPNALAAADFNRDGKLDLAVGAYDSPHGVVILRGKGDGRFKSPQAYNGSDTAEAIAVGHLKGNKGLDVVIGTDTGLDVFANKP